MKAYPLELDRSSAEDNPCPRGQGKVCCRQQTCLEDCEAADATCGWKIGHGQAPICAFGEGPLSDRARQYARDTNQTGICGQEPPPETDEERLSRENEERDRDSEDDEESNSTTIIIVVVVVILVILIATLIGFLLYRRKQRGDEILRQHGHRTGGNNWYPMADEYGDEKGGDWATRR